MSNSVNVEVRGKLASVMDSVEAIPVNIQKATDAAQALAADTESPNFTKLTDGLVEQTPGVVSSFKELHTSGLELVKVYNDIAAAIGE